MFGLIPSTRRDANIFRYFDDLERSFFSNSVANVAGFRTDISEKDGHYVLEAELPGFKKEDIKVDVNGETLTILAEHTDNKDEKDKDGNYIRRERRYGQFSRSFDITGIDPKEIKANYKDGVLELTMPKAKEEVPAAHRIEIG